MTTRKKYPRTSYLPWSESLPDDNSEDDRVIDEDDLDILLKGEIVITEKMDGENVTVYADGWHARSLDSRKRPDQDMMTAIAAQFQYSLPTHYRIHGEYLYAKHSIHYMNLERYFQVFAISDTISGMVLDWRRTVDLVDAIRFGTGAPICTVPVMVDSFDNYDGIRPPFYWVKGLEDMVSNSNKPDYGADPIEGYVIRNAGEFPLDDLSKNVAKYVRANHVQTGDHWRNQPLVPNQLRGKK